MRFAIALFFLISLGCKNNEPKPVESPLVVKIEVENSPSENQEIALEIYDFDGLQKFLNTTSDKTYVVNFWATWCAPCVKELPAFEKLNADYADKKVEVILVSLDFPQKYDSKLKPFIVERKLKSKVVALNDPDSNSWIPKVSEDWSGAIPATIIYNKDKRQFYEKSFNYDELETEVKQFLK